MNVIISRIFVSPDTFISVNWKRSEIKIFCWSLNDFVKRFHCCVETAIYRTPLSRYFFNISIQFWKKNFIEVNILSLSIYGVSILSIHQLCVLVHAVRQTIIAHLRNFIFQLSILIQMWVPGWSGKCKAIE